ncbi:MAG: glycosyltransferase family 4 protein [Candidatus Sericytochromatia bacterium]|nr:glycosyltransferase family 4 protein [Candidatus Sericytochromatia bacterium]
MNIGYMCQYFAPEVSAPSARGLEMARVWRDAGHAVKVVTAFPNHPRGVVPEGYRGRRWMLEAMEGLTVYRSWVYVTPNEGFVKRILNHLSFTASAVFQTMPRIGPLDVLVVSSPSFFPVVAAWVISRVKRVPFVFEVRDLWPGIFVMLGVLKRGPILRVLEALEMFLYRRAAHIVTVTHAFKRILVDRGVPESKVTVITNGVDLELFAPAPVNEALREEWGVTGKFVALYLGTHGISQALETHLAAAEVLRDDPDFAFVFIGDGARKRDLVAMAEAKGLTNVRFLDPVPKDQVPACYAAADVCFVPLRDIPLFDSFIPSKIFEILGCARPIIGSVEGEPAEILVASGAARVVKPEDVDALVAALGAMLDDPHLAARGARGRHFVETHYDRTALARRYEALLAGLACQQGAAAREVEA